MARDNSTVKVSFLGDASQLAREARRADQSMDAVGRRASDMGAKMGKAFALGATAAAAGAVALAKGAIDAASDMAEAVSKNQAVFGKSADSVRAWAADSQKNLLLTQHAAIEAAATFGNLFVSIGVQGPKAAEMSTALVGLAEDLSSFNNVTVDDALTALRSGLLGEVAPMRRFGVALSEARLQAEAYATGIAKPTKDAAAIIAANNNIAAAQAKLVEVQKVHGKGTLAEAQAQDKVAAASKALESAMAGQKTTLTATQKSAAAYSIIMKDTAVAQGDAARTQDGLANQSRILKKQIGDLQAEIGAKLLPHVLTAVHYVNDLIAEFQNGTGAGGQLREALSQVASAAQRMGDVLLPIASFFVQHPDVFLAVAAGVTAMKVAMGLAAAKATLMSAGLFGVAGGQTAVAASAPGAATGIAAVGGAAMTWAPYLAAAGAALYGIYKWGELAAKIPAGGSAGSPEFAAFDPNAPGGANMDAPYGPGTQLGGNRGGSELAKGKYPDDRRKPLGFVPVAKPKLTPAQQAAKDMAAATKEAQYAADQAEAYAKRQAEAAEAQRKRETDRLAAEADRRQKIADRIEAATQKVRDALARRAEISGQVRDTLLSNASIVQGGMSWTAGDLAAAFRKKMQQVQRFSQAISALVHKGFDATIIRQVAEGGVENMQTAIGLAGATKAQVTQINATQAAIDKAAGYTGDRVAKGVYGNITIPIDVYLDGKKLAPELARAVNDFNRKGVTNGSRSGRAA